MSVLSQKLAELIQEMSVVDGRIAVRFLVAIPWRKVNAELQADFPAGARNFADNISFASAPRTALYTMFRVPAWPEAETIMMLCCDYDEFHAGILDGSSPLARVQVGRVKNARVLCAFSPLLVHERIHAEMDEGDELKFLPGELSR